MDLTLSPDEQRFEGEVRAFIADNLPDDIREKVRLDRHLGRDDFMRWQQILGQQGWFTGAWPKAFGGHEWSPMQTVIFNRVAGEMHCPELQVFGPAMVGPVLYTFGTPEQQSQHLPAIRDSSIWWCQGYSEPGAGSDLAALQTQAENAGDHYRVNGQKIWTSFAHHADWMFCLVRTSREGRKQEGISFLLIDMKTPGVEVQPIRMMDGRHYLNAVFFNNVKVPRANLIGEEGRGWTYAKFLLENERVENANLRFITQELQKLRKVASEVRSKGRPLIEDPAFAAAVSAVEIQFKTLEIGLLRTLSDMHAGATVGAGKSSFIKIRGTEIAQRITELLVQASGADAQRYQPGPLFDQSDAALIGPEYALGPVATYLFCRAMTIYGGSTEVQKNIMAKHTLGL
ncbi:acyl-CoA dehydrogenase family protein [Variovorax sp. PAMC 28711]|uniref:acyl-CoA dehydrogenase family protein n=1 Tax=Variovorax sp. PAMC 28711 TaxID=1795631 RepID=UPI00078D5919|nr:acyl-CoA dehydrogenase family protein [Variovorax sp. PAMC 28711]AMM25953.1 pimeloyl-CoA dehydrogenase large subunit [Variovorax sp. PAMC 28711]